MAYSSLDNLLEIIPKQQLINLTNDTAPAVEINNEKITSAIGYADKLIDSYLRNKYVLPLKFIPELISQLSTDIAAYRLYSRRPSSIPKHIENNFQEAKEILANLQKEKMILDLPTEHEGENVASPAQMISTNKSKKDRIFSDDLMEKFRL